MKKQRWIVHSDSILRLEFDGKTYYVTPVTNLPVVLEQPAARDDWGRGPDGFMREPVS